MSKFILVGALSMALTFERQTFYKVYLPITAHSANHYKGLAMGDMHHPEDLAVLNVSWWYIWGWWTEGGAVPMVREMQMPPTCEPYILVGNEPDAQEPEGHPIAPDLAADKVYAIEQACPDSVLIVGNVTQDGGAWLAGFLENYQSVTGQTYANGIGVHCYQWRAGVCEERLGYLRGLYGGEMWVTEFNDFSGDAGNFAALLNYINGKFDRYAAFTNRQPAGNPGFPLGAIIGADGIPDARGLIYSER